MRIAKVVGTVTLSRAHPDLQGGVLRAVEGLDRTEQIDDAVWGGELMVAWDGVGAGVGDLVAMAEGPEAAQPFRPKIKPLDAYLAAILDKVDLE
jgi:microcompartment protein CcmK/EutM